MYLKKANINFYALFKGRPTWVHSAIKEKAKVCNRSVTWIFRNSILQDNNFLFFFIKYSCASINIFGVSTRRDLDYALHYSFEIFYYHCLCVTQDLLAPLSRLFNPQLQLNIIVTIRTIKQLETRSKNNHDWISENQKIKCFCGKIWLPAIIRFMCIINTRN